MATTFNSLVEKYNSSQTENWLKNRLSESNGRRCAGASTTHWWGIWDHFPKKSFVDKWHQMWVPTVGLWRMVCGECCNYHMEWTWAQCGKWSLDEHQSGNSSMLIYNILTIQNWEENSFCSTTLQKPFWQATTKCFMASFALFYQFTLILSLYNVVLNLSPHCQDINLAERY